MILVNVKQRPEDFHPGAKAITNTHESDDLIQIAQKVIRVKAKNSY